MNIDFFLEDENLNLSREQMDKMRNFGGCEKQFLFDFLNQRPSCIIRKNEEPYLTLHRLAIPFKAEPFSGLGVSELREDEVLWALDKARVGWKIDATAGRHWRYNSDDKRLWIRHHIEAGFTGINGEQCRVIWIINWFGDVLDCIFITMTDPK
jgi:hypothetical protein